MNARGNPFDPIRLERVLAFDPGLSGTSWRWIEKRWAALRHAAVTGRHGAGKTTLLDALAVRLRGRGEPPLRLFFNEERRRLSPGDRETLARCAGRVLLVDGDRHLPWDERRRLHRAAATADRTLFARHRRGFLPELIRLESTPELAFGLFERIGVPADRALIRKLFHAGNGNLRELWLTCYDLAAGGKCFGLK